MRQSRLPLILLTGTLGAGKTTLLNKALHDLSMERTAVIVNEFGDVGIDQMLIQTSSDDTIELAGGCLCCAVRGAFTDGLTDLLMARRGDFDRVIVETSGLADPGPILAALYAHPFLSTAVTPSGVVCVVDAKRGATALAVEPETMAQVALADRVVLSKTDKYPADTNLLGALDRSAPSAHRLDSSVEQFSAARAFEPVLLPRRFAASRVVPHKGLLPPEAVSLTLDRPLSLLRLEQFLDQLIIMHGHGVLRIKGLVQTPGMADAPLVVQGVGAVLAPFERLRFWPNSGAATRLVVIVRGVDPEDVRRLFANYTDVAGADLADSDALADNPLAVPGVRL
ncbi:MAG: GTP-binding protein [Pseudomonadota bacterium]